VTFRSRDVTHEAAKAIEHRISLSHCRAQFEYGGFESTAGVLDAHISVDCGLNESADDPFAGLQFCYIHETQLPFAHRHPAAPDRATGFRSHLCGWQAGQPSLDVNFAKPDPIRTDLQCGGEPALAPPPPQRGPGDRNPPKHLVYRQ
jgi:hypothetical protein